MSDLERALQLLMVKGSEGDGSLHLSKEETHALAEYVRQMQRDEHALTRIIMRHLPSAIRNATGTRGF